jgi:transcriptional activator SPT8
MEELDFVDGENDAEDEDNDNDNDNENENEDEEEAAEPDAEAEADMMEPDDVEGEPDLDETNEQAEPQKPTIDGDEPPAATSLRPGTSSGSAPAQHRSPSAAAMAETPRFRPTVRPEAVTAKLYDIVPTMAAPQATHVNALAVTPDLRYWMTGGSDGYIRKYDGVGTINGKQLLTVAQRHPFVDSVTKAGILMSYWENEEPPSVGKSSLDDHVLSPVYSLAVHSRALWLLSGLESGGINLQSVRHDEGKRIHCLREGGHTNAVSVLQLAPDEKSVLSGGWDKQILDWDLNNGQVKQKFEGSLGQISAIEPRPLSGAPIPAGASEVEVKSDTITTNNDLPLTNGVFLNGGAMNGGDLFAGNEAVNGGADADAEGSPAHESLFGSPGAGGSLFGDNEPISGGAFGGDEDDDFSRAMEATLQTDSASQNVDFSMTDGAANGTGFQTQPDSTQAQSQAQDPTLTADPNMSNGDLFGGDATGDTIMFDSVGTQEPAPTSMPAPDGPADNNLSSLPDDQFNINPLEPSLPPNMSFDTATSTQPNPSFQVSSQHQAFPDISGPSDGTNETSASTFLSASIDGTIRLWDRRVPNPVARIGIGPGVPPWCMSACWSPDGNWIYAGRRNNTVEEFSIHKANSGWLSERSLKFPNGSGPVSCVKAMPNGRHLVW